MVEEIFRIPRYTQTTGAVSYANSIQTLAFRKNKRARAKNNIHRCDFRTRYGGGPVRIQIRHAQPQCQYVRTSFRAAGVRGRHQHGGRLQVVQIE